MDLRRLCDDETVDATHFDFEQPLGTTGANKVRAAAAAAAASCFDTHLLPCLAFLPGHMESCTIRDERDTVARRTSTNPRISYPPVHRHRHFALSATSVNHR